MIKLIIFWLGSLIGVTGGIVACTIYRPFIYVVFAALLFSLFFDGLSINFFSVELYRGTSRGFEIHLADLLGLILLAHIFINRARYQICWFPSMTGAFALFFLAAMLSWLFAPSSIYNPLSQDLLARELKQDFLDPTFMTGEYPLFEMSKLLRGYLLFWLAVNFINEKRAIDTLITTASLMVFYGALASLVERYILGVYRVSLLSDINIFNCFIGMLGALILPFVFYSRGLAKTCFYGGATIAALLSIILTVSRSSLFGFVLAMGFIVIAALCRFKSSKNWIAVGITTLVCLCLFAKAAPTLLSRFFVSESIASSMVDRNLYIQAALLMGQENFFGVGINNFSAFSANSYGARVGAEPGALAHNIWYLTYAEVGLPGLLAFAWFWIAYYWLFWRCCRAEAKLKNDLVYTLLIAIFAAMFILQLQDLFHFSYRFVSIYFLSCIIIGLTVRISLLQKAALRQQLQLGVHH